MIISMIICFKCFCRASSSEFIIPFRKFSKSIDHSFSAGMRFKMRVETEDAAERRFDVHLLVVIQIKIILKIY